MKKIYIIQAGKWCKIGISEDPFKRLSSISTSCPIPPRVGFTSEFYPPKTARLIERELHTELFDLQSNGEWFEISIGRAIEECKKLIKEYQEFNDSLKVNRKKLSKTWKPNPSLFSIEEAKIVAYGFSAKGFTKNFCIKKEIPFPFVKNWRKRLNKSLKKHYNLPNL